MTGDYVAVVSVRAYTLELIRRSALSPGSARRARATARRTSSPTDDGRLYVADTRGGGISVFETEAAPAASSPASPLPGSPYGLAVDDGADGCG